MFSTWGFNHIGDRITSHLREIYLISVMRQNTAYFDVVGTGEITSVMDQDMKLIQEGISQKMGLLLTGFSGFVTAIVITFMQSWYFASIMLCQPIALILVIGVLGIWLAQTQAKTLAQYSRVDNLAQEVFCAMRDVIAYRSQARYGKKYHNALLRPMSSETRERLIFGLMVASAFTVLHWANGMGLWQADRLFHEGRCTISEALTIIYASSIAGAELGKAMPFVVAITQANNAAGRAFTAIDRVSPIDALSDTGGRISSVQGHIDLENVSFVYPSRPDQLILDRVDLNIPAGKTVALVGPSGSGKSTIFALLERLYLHTSGRILVDHKPIDELNLSWLRSHLGYVSQEVTLFHASIHENIAHGLNTTTRKHLDFAATRQLVIKAAQTAQIHSFIMSLPEDYDTLLGLRGSLLSGGQKQRIAIARAIVSQPPILLLDEATAALDSQSEKEVQEALEAAAMGRTTIVIAHRLSTIRNAAKIIVMSSGRVVEQGTHDELMAKNTLYSDLVRQQALRTDSLIEASRTPKEDPKSQPLPLDQETECSEGGSPEGVTGDAPRKKNAFWSFSSRRSIMFVWNLSKPELLYTLGGLICSVLAGISYPVHSIFFGNGVISIISPQLSTAGHTTRFWALIYLIHGVIVFTMYCARGYFFAISTSQLNLRARASLFKALLQKELSFFGKTEHSTGHLIGFLSSGITKIVGVSGISLGLVLESLAMLITGIVIGWAYGWELAGVATATIPLILISGYLQFSLIEQVQECIRRDSNAVAVANEGISAIRTVAVLGLEKTVVETFCDQSSRDHMRSRWVKFSIAYALTSSLSIFSIALVFWYGGTHLIATGEYTVRQFYICFVAIVGGSQASAAMFSHAPDIAGARSAVEQLKGLMQGSPLQSPNPRQKELLTPSSLVDLSFHDIYFRYPSRLTQLALNNVSLEAPAGRFIALVGASGSGKSSAISLIERFYRAESGQIVLGDKDIDAYEPESYHRYLALVDQDSCLVGEDLRECLQSGDEDVSDDEILAALKSVSLEEFVSSLPSGLGTPVVGNGSNLSGGQRQRVAIAKALLWKPKILLLDEATSALDTVSERAVQDTLKHTKTPRTTIAVAHRLKTIAHADEIFVFDHGCIVERGTHDELMLAKGPYSELARLQNLSSHGN
ncbi:ATP-binding cassette domain of a mitochondrial protein MTABC3 [Aspergillus parasiticus SU-1]|uniref:ATP-binding cassette domain of a mitochondrial protein MTABC3 n=1 Tax=Aspergillus parasiticus (strain ATCC 56775 / NRRL 5862 / SRRC 143 / SU-1) TaxID=1403190 RepID=A0A0F0IEE5_ASPPU|nr:ATP-binding cassette domain of a mitochondrial protein MTABC3 [Aspergillus parasiticus SU-1]